jgi:hypothetical protein
VEAVRNTERRDRDHGKSQEEASDRSDHLDVVIQIERMIF